MELDLNLQRANEPKRREFESYKSEKKTYVDSLLAPEDSEASGQLAERAKVEIENLNYEDNLSLAENKARVDEIVNKLELDLNLQRENDYSYLGKKIIYKNSVCYVSQDGTTSTVIGDDPIVWLKEESDGTYAWYGIDNSSGIFSKGSVFWVKWLDSDKNPEEWNFYYKKIDKQHQLLAEDGKLWIFLTGVTAPDGTEYHEFNVDIPYYIQLGSDWDEKDINVMFITDTSDESIKVEFIDIMQFPEGEGRFAKLILKHFSPYAIYDRKDTEDLLSSAKILTGIKDDNLNIIFLNFMFCALVYISFGRIVSKKKI